MLFWLFQVDIFGEAREAGIRIRFCFEKSHEFENQIDACLGLVYLLVGRQKGVDLCEPGQSKERQQIWSFLDSYYTIVTAADKMLTNVNICVRFVIVHLIQHKLDIL